LKGGDPLLRQAKTLLINVEGWDGAGYYENGRFTRFMGSAFVALLFWVLRENAKREENYQKLLQDLTDKFEILEDVKNEVGKISNKIFGGD
jgi:hypothetical protein